MKIAIAMMLCFVLFTCAVCYSADLTQEIKTSEGFTFYLPYGWKEIPKNVIDAYCDAFAKNVPNTERQAYDYGFQLSETQNWFEYPYIIIKVLKNGRVPESKLKSIKRINQVLNRSITKTQKYLETLISNVEIGETVYDPSLHILWTQVNSDTAVAGPLTTTIAVLLTEEGAIGIYFYVKTEEFSSYASQFEAIAQGVIIDEHLKYKPRSTDSVLAIGGIDWGKVLGVGAVVGGFLGLFSFLFRKKNPNK